MPNLRLVEARHDAVDLPALPLLEKEVGDVEEAALQEQHERHPLVVGLHTFKWKLWENCTIFEILDLIEVLGSVRIYIGEYQVVILMSNLGCKI